MQMIVFTLLVSLFLFFSFFYLTRCFLIVFKPKNKFIVGIPVFFYMLIIVVGFFSGRLSRMQKITLPEYFPQIQWISYFLLGLLLLLIIIFFIADCLFLLKKMIYFFKRKKYIDELKKQSDEENIQNGRRRLLFSMASVVAFCLFGRAFYNARRAPNVKNVIVPIEKLHPDLKSFTIVQLTDLHIGITIGKDYVERVVEKVNELNADIIVITGDLIDGFVEKIKDWVAPLERLKAKRGLFYVNGNHEYYWDAQSWARYMEEIGFTFLENEHRLLKIGRSHVVIGGVTDLQAERFDLTQKSNPKKSIIGAPKHADLKVFLAHQPICAYDSAELDYYDLQLSGHTHGGQLWPGSWLIHLIQPFSPGLTLYRKMWVYVSRGTGYWGPPVRLDADSEITHISFEKA